MLRLYDSEAAEESGKMLLQGEVDVASVSVNDGSASEARKHLRTIDITTSSGSHLWLRVEESELRRWTMALLECMWSREPRTSAGCCSNAPETLSLDVPGRLTHRAVSDVSECARVREQPLVASEADLQTLSLALRVASGRWHTTRAVRELQRRLRRAQHAFDPPLQLPRGSDEHSYPFPLPSPHGSISTALGSAPLPGATPPPHRRDGEDERQRLRRRKGVDLIAMGREERMRCKAPILSFADFCCYHLLPPDSPRRAMLAAVARLLLHDPVAARPQADQLASEELMEAVYELWRDAARRDHSGYQTDSRRDSGVTTAAAGTTPAAAAALDSNALLHGGANGTSQTAQIAQAPPALSPTPSRRDSADSIDSRTGGGSSSMSFRQTLGSGQLEPPRFLMFAKELLATLNRLAILYLCYRWDDVAALAKANPPPLAPRSPSLDGTPEAGASSDADAIAAAAAAVGMDAESPVNSGSSLARTGQEEPWEGFESKYAAMEGGGGASGAGSSGSPRTVSLPLEEDDSSKEKEGRRSQPRTGVWPAAKRKSFRRRVSNLLTAQRTFLTLGTLLKMAQEEQEERRRLNSGSFHHHHAHNMPVSASMPSFDDVALGSSYKPFTNGGSSGIVASVEDRLHPPGRQIDCVVGSGGNCSSSSSNGGSASMPHSLSFPALPLLDEGAPYGVNTAAAAAADAAGTAMPPALPPFSSSLPSNSNRCHHHPQHPANNNPNGHVTAAPERRRYVFGDRPVVLLMGGGMGAGKSSLLQEIVSSRFWREFGRDAVVIEADRIKMSSPVFSALQKAELTGGDPGLADYVHEFSTSAANEALLAAVHAGQDVIMDGTLAWAEYVRQTIDMIRHAHLRRYRIGPGYRVGTTDELYWEAQEERPADDRRFRRPYKIEVVGATCPPELAVARGIRRKLLIGRGVPVAPQLRSHRLFTEHFAEYAVLADEASLFDTSADDRPRLLAHRAEGRPLLLDPLGFAEFYRRRLLREDAANVEELYPPGVASGFLSAGGFAGERSNISSLSIDGAAVLEAATAAAAAQSSASAFTGSSGTHSGAGIAHLGAQQHGALRGSAASSSGGSGGGSASSGEAELQRLSRFLGGRSDAYV